LQADLSQLLGIIRTSSPSDFAKLLQLLQRSKPNPTQPKGPILQQGPTQKFPVGYQGYMSGMNNANQGL